MGKKGFLQDRSALGGTRVRGGRLNQGKNTGFTRGSSGGVRGDRRELRKFQKKKKKTSEWESAWGACL